MAVEANAAPTLPLPRRASASSHPTVGFLQTRAAPAAATTSSGASRGRECCSPRSLLSRVLHRGRGGGSGCRMRLPLPRYCYGGAAKEDEAAAPNVVGCPAEPRSSLAGKKSPAALPASLGLGATLLLQLSKVAAELGRMAELRAQMERLMMDVRADVRGRNGRPGASDGHTDSASVVKEPIACAGGGDVEGALSQSRGGGCESAGHRETMDQMEAELEAELSRLQLAWNDEDTKSPRRDRRVEAEAKSGAGSGSRHSGICSDSDIDDGETDHDGDEGHDEEEDERDAEADDATPDGGVPALELERRLHGLLQSRHEARIAELESALERARWKLQEKEREACRWRDTAKLAALFADESQLR